VQRVPSPVCRQGFQIRQTKPKGTNEKRARRAEETHSPGGPLYREKRLLPGTGVPTSMDSVGGTKIHGRPEDVRVHMAATVSDRWKGTSALRVPIPGKALPREAETRFFRMSCGSNSPGNRPSARQVRAKPPRPRPGSFCCWRLPDCWEKIVKLTRGSRSRGRFACMRGRPLIEPLSDPRGPRDAAILEMPHARQAASIATNWAHGVSFPVTQVSL
jgi:hypothetical protein